MIAAALLSTAMVLAQAADAPPPSPAPVPPSAPEAPEPVRPKDAGASGARPTRPGATRWSVDWRGWRAPRTRTGVSAEGA